MVYMYKNKIIQNCPSQELFKVTLKDVLDVALNTTICRHIKVLE